MDQWSRREILRLALAAGGASWLPAITFAQKKSEETRLAPFVTGEERNSQPDLWVMEVFFRPLRMIYVNVPDKKSGESKRQLYWYLCYRAVNRVLEKRQLAENEPLPIPDPNIRPPVFVPEFELITRDNTGTYKYIDRIIPEAEEVINRREARVYKNSVDIVGNVLDPVPQNKKPTQEQQVYGVAIWRNIESRTDFFTIYASGFSNGYRVEKGPDDQDLVLRKSIEFEFWRPGDEFEQEEEEIRPRANPKWIYR